MEIESGAQEAIRLGAIDFLRCLAQDADTFEAQLVCNDLIRHLVSIEPSVTPHEFTPPRQRPLESELPFLKLGDLLTGTSTSLMSFGI